MPMLASGVAMMTSQVPASAALPAKQRPETIDTSGTWPLSAPSDTKCRHVEARDVGHVGVAGPAAAAFGEQHHRQLAAGGQIEDAIGFGMVAHALRTGQDGVVVRQHSRLDAADFRHPGDQTIGRGVGDQVLLRTPAALRGDRQRAVFDETPRVHQIGDVLSGGTPILFVPLGNRCLSRLRRG